MGQKVNPIGLRLGINRTWDSRWYAEGGEYSTMLHEDIHIRKVLRARLAQAGVAKIVIERPAKRARVTIHTARPGVVIGKAGRQRWLGRRPVVRGVAMNPVDHPHGGGEGRTSGGRHPVTPWGKPTKGKKTRKNKATDKYIIRRRGATR